MTENGARTDDRGVDTGAIGRTLRDTGVVPWLTTQTWYGGNLLGEYQYALVNPVALGLFALLPQFDTLQAGAAFLGVTCTAILAAGALLLARSLGISRPLSFVAALAIATNGFAFYWLASSWFPGFLSLAFVVWAMAFVLRADRGGGAFLAAALATMLTATAGWPQTVLVLGLFVAIVAGVRAATGDWRSAAAPVLAAGLGVAAASPAIYPVVALGDGMARPTGIFNNGFLVPGLGDVLAVTNPLHHGRMLAFGGYGTIVAPTFHAAWFVVPVLCLLDWRRIAWRSPPLLVLLALTGLLLVATQGPEQLGPVRWPFRLLPHFHIALILTVLLLLTRAGVAAFSWRRASALALALLLTTLQSLQSDPASLPLIVGPAAVIVTASAILLVAGAGRAVPVALGLALITAVFALHTRSTVPRNPTLPDWRFLMRPSAAGPLWTVPRGYEFHLSGHPGDVRDPARFEGPLFGQMGLALGRSTINGYSPIGHRGLFARFCVDTHGWTCPEAGPRLLDREPTTGMPFADLMRVERVIAERGAHLDRFATVVGDPWRVGEAPPRAVVFSRPLPNADLPGSLAWPITGLSVEAIGVPTATLERLRIHSRSAGVNTLVFARAWWPGYHATFDGVPVPARRLADILVAVDLPADGSAGELVLRHRPPGSRMALVASGGALLLVLVCAGVHARLLRGRP